MKPLTQEQLKCLEQKRALVEETWNQLLEALLLATNTPFIVTTIEQMTILADAANKIRGLIAFGDPATHFPMGLVGTPFQSPDGKRGN